MKRVAVPIVLVGMTATSLASASAYTVTKSKLSLTTKSLRGGAFSRFDTEYDCFTPRRVLLRVRGEFVKPTTLRAASPITYASIAGTKRARLFIANDCQED